MTKGKKPRVALFGMGVIGGALKGHGVPVLEDLFKRLSADFDIVFYSFSNVDKSRISTDIPVRQVTRWRIPGRLKFFLISMRFVFDHVINPYQCIFSVSVYPMGLWAVRLAKVFRLRVFVQVITLELVSLPDIGYGNLSREWLRRVTHYVCKNASEIIAVSDYQRKLALQQIEVPMKITSLPLRIDPSKFTFRNRSLAVPVQFIHIAYYSPVKDQDTMFKAFALVSKQISCRLTVVGEGYDVPAVKHMLLDLNISDKITFVGLVPQAEIPKYLNSAHIMLHPARYESACAVVQEAMASGVAVCGTNVGLLSDIGDRYAVIVPPGNVEALVLGIVDLVHNQKKLESITTAAYDWIIQQNAAWSAKNYKEYLMSAVNGAD